MLYCEYVDFFAQFIAVRRYDRQNARQRGLGARGQDAGSKSLVYSPLGRLYGVYARLGFFAAKRRRDDSAQGDFLPAVLGRGVRVYVFSLYGRLFGKRKRRAG